MHFLMIAEPLIFGSGSLEEKILRRKAKEIKHLFCEILSRVSFNAIIRSFYYDLPVIDLKHRNNLFVAS